jgi:phosphoglycolate phosphatase
LRCAGRARPFPAADDWGYSLRRGTSPLRDLDHDRFRPGDFPSHADFQGRHGPAHRHSCRGHGARGWTLSPASPRRRTEPPTLVLDLDGTLVDTAGDLIGTLNAVLATEDLPPTGFDEALAMVGHGARAMLEAALEANGAAPSNDRLDRLFAQFIAHYSAHIAERSRPFPGAVAALDRFSEAGWLLAICTNKLESLSRRLLTELGLADRFAAIAGQDTFGVRKPDPRHLLETIRLAGGDPRNAVMVGDSEVDIATARAALVPVVAVEFGYSPVPVADLGPDCVIGHFDGLFAAAERLRLP